MSNQPTVKQNNNSMQEYVFANIATFEAAQRMAKALSSSDLVPKDYKDNISNALIALEVAQRTGASPLMVMQNLYIVHGRPSWSSQFIISALNTCGKFKPLRFRMTRPEKEENVEYEIFETKWVNRERITEVVKKTAKVLNVKCIAWTEDSSGEVLESPEVSIKMALDEGWYDKSGSKWKTMPELMLRYRAAAFFGRLYAPEVLMGMYTQEEVQEMGIKDVTPARDNSDMAEAFMSDAEPEEDKNTLDEMLEPEKKKEDPKQEKKAEPVEEAPAQEEAAEVVEIVFPDTGETVLFPTEFDPIDLMQRIHDMMPPDVTEFARVNFDNIDAIAAHLGDKPQAQQRILNLKKENA